MLLQPNAANRFILVAIGIYLAIVPAGTATAQNSESAVLEEIVVSARMREEGLQDVPVSVTAFTAAQLEDARIREVQDFVNLTANTSIIRTQSAGLSFISIRGLTRVRNIESPVAVVVDGVLQVNSRQFTQQLVDLERLEVLRGPQGALYGRNATGGAILITTKQPAYDSDGFVSVGVGRDGEYSLEGAFGGAIVEDKLAGRIAGRYVSRDGYFDNAFLGKKVDFLDHDINVRGQLRWDVTDDLEINARGNVTRTEGGGLNFHHYPRVLLPDGVTWDAPNFDFSSNPDSPTRQVNFADRTYRANNLGVNERDIDDLSIKIDWDFGAATLSSISSIVTIDEYTAGDNFPYTAAASPLGNALDGTQSQFVEIDAWSQELRVTSDVDSGLRWMIGAYLLETDRFISTATGVDTRNGIVRLERTPAFSDPSNPTLGFLADDNDNTATAFFANFAYDLMDTLEVSIAGRYDKDDRQQTVSNDNTAGVPGSVNRASFSKFQPKFTLRYQPNDRTTLFSSWGVGFRSGQFNQNGVADLAEAAGIAGVRDIVEQEETETLEAGFKAEFFDQTLRLNFGIFDTKVENAHVFLFLGAVGAQIITNIDEASIKGLELELTAKLTERFDVYAGLGITDTEIDRYSLDPSTSGNRLPFVPKNTLNLGAQYRAPITDKMIGFARVDYNRRGETYWLPQNLAERDPVDLVDIRLGIEDDDGTWSLSGTVRNVSDKKYLENFNNGFAHPALPRVWAVDLTYRF